MAVIELDRVRKVYPGGVEAVKGVSLTVADGSLLVLVGPSGCGKSTLLRMIAGLEVVTEGEVRIGGRRVNDLEPADRDIAMVFQNYALYPHMSVYDNLAYGLRNRRTPRHEIERRVKAAAQLLEIEPYLARRPRELSGGQRQRVAMGRAIVREPHAFLFDEPLSNLDAKLRNQMRVEIKRLQRKLGTTSVYVTHDQLEAMTLADKLVVMNNGIVEQTGTPLEVYERPATTFVASFMGAPPMNLIEVEARGDAFTAVRGTGLSALRRGAIERATLGVRPEQLMLGPPPAGTGLRVDLGVVATEPVGAETIVYGEVPGGGPMVVIRAQGRHALAPGARATAYAWEEAVHLFDPERGVRLPD